jgi:hypothetical protein
MQVSAPKGLSWNMFGSKRPCEPRGGKCQNHPVGHRLEKMWLRRGSYSVSVLQLIASLV